MGGNERAGRARREEGRQLVRLQVGHTPACPALPAKPAQSGIKKQQPGGEKGAWRRKDLLGAHLRHILVAAGVGQHLWHSQRADAHAPPARDQHLFFFWQGEVQGVRERGASQPSAHGPRGRTQAH